MPLGIENYHKDPATRRINVEKERAYYIPYGRSDLLHLPREYSDRFSLLCGEWDFKFFKSVTELPASIGELCDFSETLSVPMSWQAIWKSWT